MDLHQCASFANNLCLVHEHDIRQVTKYLASTSTYVNLPDVNQQLTTRDVVYKPDIEKLLSVTYMPTLLVYGLKQMPIMQKIPCCIRDM